MRLPFHLVVLDIETNGGMVEDPTAHRIIEIGAIRVDEEMRIASEFSMLIDGRPVLPEVVDIHGIRNEDLEGKPKFAEAHSEFDEWCGKKQDYLLAAWGAYFDIPVLRSEYQKIGMKFPHRGEAMDVKGAAWMDLLKQGKPVRHLGLEQAAALYGIPFFGRKHKAVDDARMTVRVLQAVAGKRQPNLNPVLVLSTVYVVFRGRQLGWFRKILPAEEQHTDV
jgi:DNA polymerase-3 subunit epsilon